MLKVQETSCLLPPFSTKVIPEQCPLLICCRDFSDLHYLHLCFPYGRPSHNLSAFPGHGSLSLLTSCRNHFSLLPSASSLEGGPALKPSKVPSISKCLYAEQKLLPPCWADLVKCTSSCPSTVTGTMEQQKSIPLYSCLNS